MEVMSTYFARLRRCAAAAAAAALSFGCTQTEIDSTIVGPEGGVEHEVVFDFVCEEYTGTATFDPTSDGTVQTRTPSSAGFAFEDGAVIHVLAEFTKKQEFRGKKVGAYECYRYNKQSGTWTALGSSEDNPTGARMLWPLNTQSGKFTAFYVPAQANILGFGESNVVTTELQSLNMIGQRDGSDHVIGDPLQAEIDSVGYDGKVRLVFRHACTRLILSDIRGTSDMAYRIVRDASSDNDLNNGYQLQIERTAVADGANEYTYTGKFIWGKVEDEKLNLNNSDGVEKYYVSAPLSSDAGNPDMSDPKNNWLCFYLEPGNYYGSIVTYRNNDIYLTLNVAGLGGEGDTAPKEEQGLEANKSYMMDIRMVDGVVNNELVETPDEWAPADEEAIPVDVEKFMKALEQGEAYEEDHNEKKYQILERTSNGLKLNYNVDFQNVNLYHLFKDDDKDLSTFRRAGSNLDGQNHAIVNVNGALFYNLNATISNLAIRHAKITFPQTVNATTHQPAETGDVVTAEELIDHYNNCVGLFTTISGSLNNVLIEGITVEIDLEEDNNKLETMDAANIYPNIGALCGSLTGISGITGVHLRGTADHEGNITVNVKGPNLYRANFSIGGLVGRLSAGPLQNVDLYMGDAEYYAPTINVTTNMGKNKESEATDKNVLSQLEVGGIVGYAEYGCSDISLISCPITVDCKESISNLCHAGGFAGRARGNYTVDDPNSGYIDNVSVGATVTGGKCTITSNNGQEYYGNSYTGGLVGYVQSRQISGCTVSGSVTAGSRVDNSDVYSRISTGGIIGCIADRVQDGTFNHYEYDIKKSRVYDCTAYVTMVVTYDWVGGSTEGESMRYYAGRCIGMQNYPNTGVYTQSTNSCFVPAPSRRDLSTFNFANEKLVFYDQSKKLSELSQPSFILNLGDATGDGEHHGWNPYDSGVGNINYTTRGDINDKLPFCGAYADEKNSDKDNGDVWTD